VPRKARRGGEHETLELPKVKAPRQHVHVPTALLRPPLARLASAALSRRPRAQVRQAPITRPLPLLQTLISYSYPILSYYLRLSFLSTLRPRRHYLPLEVTCLSEVRRRKAPPLVSLGSLEVYPQVPAYFSPAPIFQTCQVQVSPSRSLKKPPRPFARSSQVELGQTQQAEETPMQLSKVAVTRGPLSAGQTTSKVPFGSTGLTHDTYNILSSAA